MANTIKIKRSSTASAVPSSLEYGELAINYADGKLFYKNASNQIVELVLSGGGGGGGADEVLEYTATTDFPATGNTSYLYIATDTSRVYRWTGSVYVEVGPATAIANHAHSAADITSGVLPASQLPTRLKAAANLYLWSSFR